MGSPQATPKTKKHFFSSEITKPDHKLSKTFIILKHQMFRLSYECFSILWCFFAKNCHFQENPNRGDGGLRIWNFQRYQTNSMQNFQGLILICLEFPGVNFKIEKLQGVFQKHTLFGFYLEYLILCDTSS